MMPPTPFTSSVAPIRSGATSSTLRAKKARFSGRPSLVLAGLVLASLVPASLVPASFALAGLGTTRPGEMRLGGIPGDPQGQMGQKRRRGCQYAKARGPTSRAVAIPPQAD